MRILRNIIIAACLNILAISAGYAEDEVSLEITTDFFSKYVWRGQNLVNDWVFQPGLSASYKGFTASIWGSLDLTDENGFKGNFTEIDYSLDYSRSVPGIDVLGYSVGVIYYDFPHTGVDGTTELYWGFSADVLLSPSVIIYHDVDEADGIYICATIGHSIEKIYKLTSGSAIGLEFSASIGWGNGGYNEFYWGVTSGGLNDLVLSASFPIEAASWTITPSINYMRLLGSDIRDSNAYGTDDNILYTSIGFAREF